jgi:uncharacterized protein (TIGR02145 family)
MKIIYLVITLLLFCGHVFSQKEPKVKEIDYHFEYNSKDFIGEYDGEVFRVEIDGKKRKTPVGYGIFKGKYEGFKNEDLWIVYSGNWHNGQFEGSGTFITLSTNKGIEPNWKEIEIIFTDSSRGLPKPISECYVGRFSSNIFNGDSSTIKTANYEYYGGVVNWLPHGNGKKIKNDTLVISSIPMKIKEYEGVFTNGVFEKGVIRLLGKEELTGDLIDGMFTGEGKLTFTKNLAVSLMDTIVDAVSFNGKISASKFESGQMTFASGEMLTGDWRNNLFTGKGKFKNGETFFYEGDWLNGKEHGNGRKTKNDTLVISSIPMMINEYEGVFKNGKFENGVIRLLGGDELKGDLKDGVFTGETKVTFSNKLSIALADTIFQAVSYFGKIKNNKFDNGQMSFESGETLTGDWIDNLFTGKGKLNVGTKYWYEGDWEKGRIQGKGKKVIDDTLNIESVSIFVKEYEGQFSDGIFENGFIRIAGDGELKGILKDGEFSGEGKMTFQKSLAISLAKNSYEAISYSGKIIDSKFDNGQMKLKSGETLTGVWTNKLFSGSGKLNLGDTYSYDGDWLEGDIHGQGEMTKKNEWLFTGLFNKNQIDGSGELMYFSGNTYVSNFHGKLKEDEIDIRLENNDKLKIIAFNDLTIEGSIIDNTFLGFGELELDNKAVYKGSISMSFDGESIDESFYSDELYFTKIKSGEGRLSYSNRDTLHVRWDKDGYIGKGRLNFGVTENGDSLYEEGTFRNGLLDGQGKKCFMYKLYKDDEQKYYLTYNGQFQDGAMHGKGVLDGRGLMGDVSLDGDWVNDVFAKGTMVEEFIVSDEDREVETYTGEFLDNQRHGQGVLKSYEGIYTGTFVDGFPHGNGKYVYADGRIYEGEMKDGAPSGIGKMTLKNKQVLNGKFEDGEYQKPFSCKEVKIGDQIWMAENLNVDHFRNGDIIPEAKSSQEWQNAFLNDQPAWCYYENKEINGSKYGKLYNWSAVNDPRGLAPEGWHIPNNSEWTELIDFLGGKHVAGIKMKSKSEWLIYPSVGEPPIQDKGKNKGSNESGFSAIPCGSYSPGSFFDGFTDKGTNTTWWSSSISTYCSGCTEHFTQFSLHSDDSYIWDTSTAIADEGVSIRCIKD